MKYMIVFAAVVIMVGIIFMISTMHAARKNASQTPQRESQTQTSAEATPSEAATAESAVGGNSREDDDAYRDALRQHASSRSTSLRQPTRQSLSDKAYREALRRVSRTDEDR